MNKKYLISIIMPIYNSEAYLSKTIKSIIKQSFNFKYIELILIDDCSTDDSKKIIEEYSAKYKNIKPIYLKKNSGSPGFVRNKGLDISSADYIMFIDSDDEYEKDMCKNLYNTLIENNCDCVKCNFNVIKSTTEVEVDKNYSNKLEKRTINPKEELSLNPEEAMYNFDGFLWNKIFKKSILKKNNIKFVNSVGEDGYFCMEYYIESQSIIYLDNYHGYKYYNREGSYSTINLKWILNIMNSNKREYKRISENSGINLYKSINPTYYIFCAIQLKENDWNSIFKVLSKINLFEKEIKFSNNKKLSFIYRFINTFIMNNHISIATLIVYILNRIVKIKKILLNKAKK